METFVSIEDSHVDVLHEISERLGTADAFHEVLTRVEEFASALVKCVSCLFSILEGLELARLDEANSSLADQLQTRKIVERAKGILQRDLGLNEVQAYLALQRQSRQKRKPMKEIAEAIVLVDDIRGNSQPPTTYRFLG